MRQEIRYPHSLKTPLPSVNSTVLLRIQPPAQKNSQMLKLLVNVLKPMIHKCLNDPFPWDPCIGKIWILWSLPSFNIGNCTLRVGPGAQRGRIYLLCMISVQSIVITKNYFLWKKTSNSLLVVYQLLSRILCKGTKVVINIIKAMIPFVMCIF